MSVKFQIVVGLLALLCGHMCKTVSGVATCADHFGEDYCNYPLHWAALSGDVKGALAAIQMGKRIDEEIPGYGTPLHQAAFYGRANVVKLLLQNGADVATTDLDGDTPIKTTDMKWCSHKRNDRTCHMNPSDYRETVYLLTSGCKTIGCSGVMRCRNNRCVNLCDKIMCGINGVCSVHEERAVCRCNGDDYSGDPAIMCLKMGEAKYIFKAFCFVKDMITNIASAIVKDIKSVYYETKVPIKY